MACRRRPRGAGAGRRQAALAVVLLPTLLLALLLPSPALAQQGGGGGGGGGDLPPRPDWCDKWYPKIPPLRRKPVALLLGDSITQMAVNADGGWAGKLAEQGPRHFDVMTRGFSGWNTRWWRPLARTITRDALGLPEQSLLLASGGVAAAASAANAAPPREAAFITLWLGANDLVPPESDEGPKYVPIDQYEANLEAIARDVIAAAAEAHKVSAAAAADGPGRPRGRAPQPVRLVIVAPAPIGEKLRVEDQAWRAKVCRDKRGEAYFASPKGPPPDRTSAASWSYSRAALKVAERLRAEFGADGKGGGGAAAGVPVVVAGLDLHAVLKPEVDRDGGYGRSVYVDGVHLSPEGQRRVGDAVFRRLLQPAAEGGVGVGSFWDALPVQMPAWEQVEGAGSNWRRFLSPWVMGG
jgi:lysophospholipase L1-like esterase